MKCLGLIIWMLVAISNSTAQNIFFNISANNNPPRLLFNDEQVTSNNFHSSLIYRVDVGLEFIKNQSVEHFSLISSVYYQDIAQEIYNSINPSGITLIKEVKHIGLNLGFAYSSFLSSGSDKIQLPLTVECGVPITSKFGFVVNEDDSRAKPFLSGDNFKKGIFYGISCKPTYSFALNKKRSNPLRFGAFIELRLINSSITSSKWLPLYGGGIQVLYSVN